MKKIDLTIASSVKKVYEGQVDMVVAPGWEGDFAILPGHAPLLTSLKKGEIRVKTEEEQRKFPVEGGFLEVHSRFGNSEAHPDTPITEVTILANTS